MQIRSRFLREAFSIAALAASFFTSTLDAAWTSLTLPNVPNTFGSYQAANLPDGRLLYASKDALGRQTTFGSSPLDAFQNPQSWDPSDVTVFGNTVGVIGVGGFFGTSAIYRFDPMNLATPFTAIPGVTLQNYTLVMRDAASLYVGGLNGTGGAHAIRYVALDGSVNKVIIDNISTYSGDFAMDVNGNLFVSDNDDLKLYKFTSAQVSDAIAGSALTLANGLFVTDLNKNLSIAVDGLGRIWSAGYQSSGIDMYDPGTNSTSSFIPALDNTNYVVSTFSTGTDSYVAYLNASGTGAGAALTYGYEKSANLVPEPSTSLLLAISAAGLVARRRRA